MYVPAATFIDYWSADVWKEFANIKPFTEISAISFDAENYTIETNESLQLEATVAPSNASVSDMIWTSSNPAIATVSSSGKVEGIAPGEVIITAKTVDGSNLSAICTVTVEAVLAESITLSQSESNIAPYESIVLTYTILPENTSNKSVTWTSSDETIVTFKVNEDGSATVLKLNEGIAVITATTNDGSNLSASCKFGVPDVLLSLNSNTILLAKNEWTTLTATVTPADLEYEQIAWSVDNESIVRVIDNGDNSAMILALGDGKATVTATTTTADGKTLIAKCVVTVSSAGIEDVAVDESTVTVETGDIVVKNVNGIVSVYNLTGVAIASKGADGGEVRFSGLQSGVYIVVVDGKAVKVML